MRVMPFSGFALRQSSFDRHRNLKMASRSESRIVKLAAVSWLLCEVWFQVKVPTSSDASGVLGYRFEFEPSSVAQESPVVPLFGYLFRC